MRFIDLNKQQKLIRSKIDRRIKSVLDQGNYIMGNQISVIEEKLAEYVGVKYCLSCSSGTDALLIALMANKIGPGHAVLTSPFTYIATASVISLLGATPVFVDIDIKTYNIDPDLIPQAINSAIDKKLEPKAIIPVDLFGLPADHLKIESLAKDFGLIVIEDGAQGFGGEISGKKACSFGDISATSFFPAKPLGCYGDGGALFTNDYKLYNVMKSIRVHGSGSDKYDNVRLGINGRLDEIQAAILHEKLLIFPEELISRNLIASYYKENLPDNFHGPEIPDGFVSSWAQFSILTRSKLSRENIMTKLKENNIPSAIYYKRPLHLQKLFHYLSYKENDFPVAEDISKRIFSIPMHPYLEKTDQDKILTVLNSI